MGNYSRIDRLFEAPASKTFTQCATAVHVSVTLVLLYIQASEELGEYEQNCRLSKSTSSG
jgi:hypothetical protein